MKVLVVGLGVQGHKRREHAKADYVACVDPVHPSADYRDIADVPLNAYDAALICTPDKPKIDLLRYCLLNKKHVFVEKPLWAESRASIEEIDKLARANNLICYTAYNHRFEPHFMAMKELLESGKLGQIYSCRMFYGNGTARLVRNSVWRDQGAGVLPDLGSHLLDTCRFWFGASIGSFKLISAHRFENSAPDHVIISSERSQPRIELEMTLCMWRNHFTCDILAEAGTAHIESLCKWGPTSFTHRIRVLPSGRPTESSTTLVQQDPTWATEYDHFKTIVAAGRPYDLSNDLWLHDELGTLAQQI